MRRERVLMVRSSVHLVRTALFCNIDTSLRISSSAPAKIADRNIPNHSLPGLADRKSSRSDGQADIFRIDLLSRAPFRNTNRVPVHRGITSKPRLVASIRRQHKQTPPCFQAAVDVNIRIESLSALNKVTVSIIPKLRDAWRGSNWQLENPSIHRLGYRPVEDTVYYWVDSGRGQTSD